MLILVPKKKYPRSLLCGGLWFAETLPSCRSPESPGLRSRGPPCRRTDTPPRYEAPRCRDAPSHLTAGRGNRLHTSLKARDSPVLTPHLFSKTLTMTQQNKQTAHPHADNRVKTGRSPESLPSGMVLFSISFCFSSGSAGKTSEEAKGNRQRENNRHTEKAAKM